MVFAVFSYAPTGADLRHMDDGFRINPVGKTMGEVGEILADVDNNRILANRFGKNSMGELGQHLRFFYHISQNRRYRDIEITGFSYNNDGYCQFCAYTLCLGSGEYVIAYRGTDGSLEGWYESYRMFHYDIPSQNLAVAYFQQELKKSGGKYRLVGHSKGGNLALSAATLCETVEKTHIRSIINFDGPGFSLEFVNKHYKSMLLIQHKTYCFCPEDAMISALLYGQDILYYDKNIRFVKPYGLQIPPSQHLYFSWAINKNNRFELSRQSKLSVKFKESMRELFFIHAPDEIDGIFEEIFAGVMASAEESGKTLGVLEIMTICINARLKLSAGHKINEA